MDAFRVGLSAAEAARLRMEVAASNLAVAETSAPPGGAPPGVLRVVQREDRFESHLRGVETSLQAVARPPRVDLDPSHPDADALGRVFYPDVDLAEEMGEMMAARRSYEAGLAAFSEAKAMFLKTLELGRP